MARPTRNRSPRPPREPNARIAELYGRGPAVYEDSATATAAARHCPFRNTVCDVSANRHRTAFLDLNHQGVNEPERAAILAIYDDAPLPLGICSCWIKRQNEQEARPWILCPKRLLTIERPKPLIPKEVRRLIEIPDGTRVGVWRELKLRRRDSTADSDSFFEYTFDYLLMVLDENGQPIGVPYIIEVMTSSTRGGGLTEHMVDVLLGRKQRHLRGVVKSVYSPNYRQVFERMLGQFIAKSEIAEKWGGRTIWVFQEVLLDYIEQTTAFDSAQLVPTDEGNVFVEIYRLAPRQSDEPDATNLHLTHFKSLRGRARLVEESSDFTALLGLGYAPDVEDLRSALRRGSTAGAITDAEGGWFEFVWGQDVDPREGEPTS